MSRPRWLWMLALLTVHSAWANETNPLDRYTRTWQMDWESSTGVAEMMSRQGIPRLMASLIRGSRVEQHLELIDGDVHSTMRLPIGSIGEVWVLDGEWREQRSRLGRHRLKATIEHNTVRLEREFDDYTLTEVYRLDGDVLENERTLVRDETTTIAVRRLTPVATKESL